VGSGLLGSALQRHLAELKAMPTDALVAARQEKFRKIARCYTEG
jgi:acetyl-CoA carboxylase carboxyl transferase subunit alpha